MVRPDVKQDYTLYGALPATVSLRRIKVTSGYLGTGLEPIGEEKSCMTIAQPCR